jgi:hypothetical protein
MAHEALARQPAHAAKAGYRSKILQLQLSAQAGGGTANAFGKYKFNTKCLID